jgi:hypothetical protein
MEALILGYLVIGAVVTPIWTYNYLAKLGKPLEDRILAMILWTPVLGAFWPIYAISFFKDE